MSSDPSPNEPSVARSTLAVVLTWLLPGLGHAYVGRPRRAGVFAALILLMFVVGLVLDGALSTPRDGSYLSVLATVADLGVGPLYFLVRAAGWGVGEVTSATHEIANTFHWSAGIMNMLLCLDAFDIAQGRK